MVVLNWSQIEKGFFDDLHQLVKISVRKVKIANNGQFHKSYKEYNFERRPNSDP